MKKHLLRLKLVSLLTVMIISSIGLNKLYAQVAPEDRQILIDLYDATNGDSWTDKTNWGTSEPVGSWYGVTVASDQITAIRLDENNLDGTIPASLGGLLSLQYLELDTNKLSGIIPDELGNLPSLQQLYLSGNQLTGSIPTALGAITNLKWLNLRDNLLTGTIPIELGQLSQLEYLQLGLNQLTGSIPSQLNQLSALKWLNLEDNQLDGAIPSELGDLLNLEQLYLNNNQLTGTIPIALGGLTKLVWLNLGQNLLTGDIPAGLSTLLNLELLYLDGNQLTTIPVELGLLTGLEWLNLSNNQFAGDIPAEIWNLTSLQLLYLNGNQLTGTIPNDLTSIANLKWLFLNSNLLTSLPDLTFEAGFMELNVAENKLTFEDLEYNMDLIPGVNFTYSPQDSIGVAQEFTKNEGETLSYTLTTGGTQNSYQWYKDGDILVSKTSETLGINNITAADAGNYYCEVTNTLLPGLTLTSREITLLMNEDFELSFTDGWNIFSSPVLPGNKDLKDILQPLIDLDVLLKVMNEKGQVIEERESGWINNINDMESTEGYKIKVSADATLNLTGIATQLPIDIPLTSGWNIISWPSSTGQNGLAAFDELITGGQLIKVMNEMGQAMEDRGDVEWFNGIGNLMPGEGYKVKVSSDCILTISESALKSEEIKSETITSTHFVPAYIGNGTDHMNIYLVNVTESGIVEGDEIGIFDDNICVGSAKITMSNSSIINLIASADEGKNEANGFKIGNGIQLKLFRNGEEYPLSVSSMNNSSNQFERNGTTFLKVNMDINTGIELPGNETAFVCYPNPFNEIINIEINLQQREELTVEVYDLLSRRIRVLYNGSAEGMMKLQWDANDSQGNRVTPGVYVCRVNGLWEKIVLN